MFYFLKKNKKLILINFLIFIFFLLIPPLLLFSYQTSKNFLIFLKGDSKDIRANFPQFKDKEFSNQIFKEKDLIEMEYRSFIGWRPKNVKMKYTNIIEPYNTRLSTGENINDSTWFFGGSTMWSFGASDEGTIPSLYNKKTNLSVYNFGEQSWTSRQSLNQLLNLIGDGHKPKVIIFYDGVNDISIGCQSIFKNVPVHSREHQISQLTQNQNKFFNYTKVFEFFLEPYKVFSRKFFKSVNSSKIYDCDINELKAKKVATHLVNNWYGAYLISTSYNSDFLAILQPNLYISVNKRDQLPFKINSQEEAQFNLVYPLILKEIEKKCRIDPVFCSSFVNGF